MNFKWKTEVNTNKPYHTLRSYFSSVAFSSPSRQSGLLHEFLQQKCKDTMCHLATRIPSNQKETRVTFRVQSGAEFRKFTLCLDWPKHLSSQLSRDFLGEKKNNTKKKTKNNGTTSPRERSSTWWYWDFFFWRREKGNFSQITSSGYRPLSTPVFASAFPIDSATQFLLKPNVSFWKEGSMFIRKLTHKAVINIVKQCFSNNSVNLTFRRLQLSWNIYFQKHPLFFENVFK